MTTRTPLPRDRTAAAPPGPLPPGVRTRFGPRGLLVAGAAADAPPSELPLWSGAMHYWRVDRAAWQPCLKAIAALGLRIVDTYVPWSVHETAPGRFDFSGGRDLGAFLDEAQAAGLRAIVRPGPHINAELTDFGFPARIVRDDAIRARSGRDTPVWLPIPPRMFAVPSYASSRFRDEVTRWFAAVGEVVAPRLAPLGPVVAAQVDNEMQMFFRVGAYDHDYHPDALAWWAEQEAGEAPRAWSAGDAARCVRWVRFKEEYTRRSLTWMAAALRGAGLDGLALYHNLPPGDPWLVNLPSVESAVGGACGLDFYQRAADYEKVRRRALYLAGSSSTAAFAPEVGVGGPLWLPTMTPADQQATLLQLLASGVRGLGFFMIVDRERWYGAAIGRDGRPRESADMVKQLVATAGRLALGSLRRRVRAALVLSRADARFATASSVADPLSPVLTDLLPLGPGGSAELALDAAAADHRRWLDAIIAALDRAHVPYAIVDEDCAVERLTDFALIVQPTLDRVDRAGWRRLREAARRGSRIVYGPRLPTRDELGEPLGDADAAPPRRGGLMSPGSLEDVAGLAADLAAAAGAPREFSCPGEPVDASLFEDASGRPAVLFLGNPGALRRTAHVRVPATFALRDALSGERMVREPNASIAVPLAGFEVRILEVHESPARPPDPSSSGY